MTPSRLPPEQLAAYAAHLKEHGFFPADSEPLILGHIAALEAAAPVAGCCSQTCERNVRGHIEALEAELAWAGKHAELAWAGKHAELMGREKTVRDRELAAAKEEIATLRAKADDMVEDVRRDRLGKG